MFDVTIMGGGRPVPLLFVVSSSSLSPVSMFWEFNGAKKFRVAMDVAGWVLGDNFSPVLVLFFLFLSWKPSVSSADGCVDGFSVVLEDGDAVVLPTLF